MQVSHISRSEAVSSFLLKAASILLRQVAGDRGLRGPLKKAFIMGFSVWLRPKGAREDPMLKLGPPHKCQEARLFSWMALSGRLWLEGSFGILDALSSLQV